MKNWPGPELSFWRSLRIAATDKALRFADGREESKWEALRSLQTSAQYHLRPREYAKISCPAGLDVEVPRVAFADLFLLEEFSSLRKGLSALLSECGGNLMSSYKANSIDEWFEEAYSRTAGSVATTNVGWLDFGQLNEKHSPQLFEKAQIRLAHLSPSAIALSMIVHPSASFERSFQNLISTTPSPRNEISGFNLRRGITSAQHTPSSHVRAVAYDELFLDLNQEAVRIFRKYIGCGLSSFGPLPSVEVLGLNKSLRRLPKQRSQIKSDELKECVRFFESLGYPARPRAHYGKGHYRLYEVSRSSHYDLNSYQLLLSLKDYEEITPEKKQLAGGAKRSMLHSASYGLHDLCFFLGLEHLHRTLQNSVLALRREFAPALNRQASGEAKVESLRRGISRMSEASILLFQNERVWAELEEENSLDFISRGMRSFSREAHSESDSGLLADDIVWKIERMKEFSEQQLSLLRSSYDQMLSHSFTESAYKIQRKVLWLTALVAALTIVLLIPTEPRNEIMKSVWGWLLERVINPITTSGIL